MQSGRLSLNKAPAVPSFQGLRPFAPQMIPRIICIATLPPPPEAAVRQHGTLAPQAAARTAAFMVNSALTKKTYKVIRKGIHTANHLGYKLCRRRINWRRLH